MNREHSLEVSIGVSKSVLNELKRVIKLHAKTTQYIKFSGIKIIRYSFYSRGNWLYF